MALSNKNKNNQKNKKLAAESVILQKQKPKTKMHEPVLLKELLELISPTKGEIYLDVTAGYGGHAKAILGVTKNFEQSILVDRDQMAIDYLYEQFANTKLNIQKGDFLEISKILAEKDTKFDIILADLGVSSPHLNIASRGFSFMNDGPLDMRMDQTQSLSANNVVNDWKVEDIERIIKSYGEDRNARKIAKAIVANRPIKSTGQLAEVIARVVKSRWQSIHPATKTFQAIRIAVNDEITMLKEALPIWLEMLNPGGRLAVISFHSIEDRIVKRFMSEYGGDRYDADLKVLTKKPITASKDELVFNPRSRSAKLRVAVKIKIKERASDAN